MPPTPESLVTTLQAAHGRAFLSAFLYGSAAHDGHDHRWSDVNLVVVVERVEAAALARAARVEVWT
jgi:predicted nucleotidyltransferase